MSPLTDNQRVTLHLIGYWSSEPRSVHPDPHDLIDEAWDEEQRLVVAGYLDTGTYLRGAMGLSECRICGQPNGSGEYTDGTSAWSEGLAHTCESTPSGSRPVSRSTSSERSSGSSPRP